MSFPFANVLLDFLLKNKKNQNKMKKQANLSVVTRCL